MFAIGVTAFNKNQTGLTGVANGGQRVGRFGFELLDVGIRVAILPLADLAALDAMRPDFPRLKALGGPLGITVFYPFVYDHASARVRARSFAPAVDIDEDPATGTATASLGAYLAREGLVEETAELRVRQGEAMGRPSELRLRIEHQDRRPRRIRVGGPVTGEPAG